MIGVAKIRLCYQVKKIYLISLLVDDNRNNEDYCINHTDLVPTCNDYLLTYFFDHNCKSRMYLTVIRMISKGCRIQ